jgi:hypothetical protein
MSTQKATAATSVALKLSGDSKVTNAVAVSKTGKVSVAVKNSFGLPAGSKASCPGATPTCDPVMGGGCYGGRPSGAERYTGVRNLLWHNFETLKATDYSGMVDLLSAMIDEFITDSAKRNAPLIFRIHWDGDYFSGTYTAAWSKVIASYPQVQFWSYTRVAASALFLHAQKHENLGLYFSGDRDNVETAQLLAGKGIHVAFLADTFDAGKQQFPDAVRCPQNNGALKIIDADGSACSKCRLCVDGRRDVLFKMH